MDEVGDLSLALQSKLLRFLQERVVERIGGREEIPVDVRIVCATHQNLKKLIEEERFREDLYYRLSEIIINIPPLRERHGDVEILVRYYVDKYAQRMNKRIDSIPQETMAALGSYFWPGNIRELQNLIERSVILTAGNILQAQLDDLQQSTPIPAPMAGTLEDVERQRILEALQESGAVIGGRNGAAVRLGLKRTTLLSKMQKLGIARNTNYTPLLRKESSKDLPLPVKR